MTSETSSITYNFPPRIAWAGTSSTGISTRLNPIAQSRAYGLLTPLLTNTLILHLHHHFPQTRLAGSCAAELQAHTVFRK